MRLFHIVISAISVLLLTFIGGSWLFEEYNDWIYYGKYYGYGLFGQGGKNFNFFILDFSIPILLIFLILYNLDLIKNRPHSWTRIGLIISEFSAGVGLVLGVFLQWGSLCCNGGYNQFIALILGLIPLSIQLIITLIVVVPT